MLVPSLYIVFRSFVYISYLIRLVEMYDSVKSDSKEKNKSDKYFSCNHLKSTLKMIFRRHSELGHHRLGISGSLRSIRTINVVSFKPI